MIVTSDVFEDGFFFRSLFSVSRRGEVFVGASPWRFEGLFEGSGVTVTVCAAADEIGLKSWADAVSAPMKFLWRLKVYGGVTSVSGLVHYPDADLEQIFLDVERYGCV